jgi:hypothetical protein
MRQVGAQRSLVITSDESLTSRILEYRFEVLGLGFRPKVLSLRLGRGPSSLA